MESKSEVKKEESRLERWRKNSPSAKSEGPKAIVKRDEEKPKNSSEAMMLALLKEPQQSALAVPQLTTREGLGEQISGDATVALVGVGNVISTGLRLRQTELMIDGLQSIAREDAQTRRQESTDQTRVALEAEETARRRDAAQHEKGMTQIEEDSRHKNKELDHKINHDTKSLNHQIFKETEDLGLKKREVALEEAKFQEEQEARKNSWGCSVM